MPAGAVIFAATPKFTVTGVAVWVSSVSARLVLLKETVGCGLVSVTVTVTAAGAGRYAEPSHPPGGRW